MNILLDPLPVRYNGCRVNMGFRIGIQVFLAFEDRALSDQDRSRIIVELIFGDYDDETDELHLYDFSKIDDFEALVDWYVNGWCQDNPSRQKKQQRVMDYHKDQWRIYADFRKVYGINLTVAELHWWEFCGLLWNMPYEQSSFLQIVDIRQKEPEKWMDTKARARLRDQKRVYQLGQPEKQLTVEDEQKIDEFDRMMAELRGEAHV